MAIVYFICNVRTQRIYVGSTTKPLRARILAHFSCLKFNKHKSLLMQQDHDTYGYDTFHYGICETIPLTAYGYRRGSSFHLRIAEQYYLYSLDALSPRGYNTNPWPAGRFYGKAEFYFDWAQSGAVDLPRPERLPRHKHAS